MVWLVELFRSPPSRSDWSITVFPTTMLVILQEWKLCNDQLNDILYAWLILYYGAYRWLFKKTGWYMKMYLFTDTDECSSAPCMNGGTCSDALNKYICICKSGYADTNCQTGKWCLHVLVYMMLLVCITVGVFDWRHIQCHF